MELEQFVYKNQKKLRCGYTTGTCAAAAAKAAVRLLFSGKVPAVVSLALPNGVLLELPVEHAVLKGEHASCAIQKSSGDDPDVTDGVYVFASVSKIADGIKIDGGNGVGRVTRMGLDQRPGEAAINTVPRRMIEQEVRTICKEFQYNKGLSIVISVPGGAEIAAKTFNPRLGIEGGISILGTSGMVEPMSEQALIDTIHTEMRMHRLSGQKTVILTPGNYGETYLQDMWGVSSEQVVKCSNFIGDSLDIAVELGFTGLLLVGHAGKLIKVAGGIMNTHSHYADARMEILCAHAGMCGASAKLLCKVMDCVTVDEAMIDLKRENLLNPVMNGIMEKIDFYMSARVHGNLQTGAIIFSNTFGELGRTPGAEAFMQRVKRGE